MLSVLTTNTRHKLEVFELISTKLGAREQACETCEWASRSYRTAHVTTRVIWLNSAPISVCYQCVGRGAYTPRKRWSLDWKQLKL